eukprot:3283165-Pyramimonas_sp.AAC.2
MYLPSRAVCKVTGGGRFPRLDHPCTGCFESPCRSHSGDLFLRSDLSMRVKASFSYNIQDAITEAKLKVSYIVPNAPPSPVPEVKWNRLSTARQMSSGLEACGHSDHTQPLASICLRSYGLSEIAPDNAPNMCFY